MHGVPLYFRWGFGGGLWIGVKSHQGGCLMMGRRELLQRCCLLICWCGWIAPQLCIPSNECPAAALAPQKQSISGDVNMMNLGMNCLWLGLLDLAYGAEQQIFWVDDLISQTKVGRGRQSVASYQNQKTTKKSFFWTEALNETFQPVWSFSFRSNPSYGWWPVRMPPSVNGRSAMTMKPIAWKPMVTWFLSFVEVRKWEEVRHLWRNELKSLSSGSPTSWGTTNGQICKPPLAQDLFLKIAKSEYFSQVSQDLSSPFFPFSRFF